MFLTVVFRRGLSVWASSERDGCRTVMALASTARVGACCRQLPWSALRARVNSYNGRHDVYT